MNLENIGSDRNTVSIASIYVNNILKNYFQKILFLKNIINVDK